MTPREVAADGRAVYRVWWKDGQPFIQTGKVVVTGKAKKTRRVQFKGEDKLLPFSLGHLTIKEALEEEILDIALIYGRPLPLQKSKPRPWDLMNCVVEVRRLYKKLRRYNLV